MTPTFRDPKLWLAVCLRRLISPDAACLVIECPAFLLPISLEYQLKPVLQTGATVMDGLSGA
jgi:hypothetical protein